MGSDVIPCYFLSESIILSVTNPCYTVHLNWEMRYISLNILVFLKHILLYLLFTMFFYHFRDDEGWEFSFIIRKWRNLTLLSLFLPCNPVYGDSEYRSLFLFRFIASMERGRKLICCYQSCHPGHILTSLG